MDGGFAFATRAKWKMDEDLDDVVGPTPNDIVLLPGEGIAWSNCH
jgi:hypothetical protein